MARRLRVQYEDAVYHVINRGNYRQDVFASVGAARAFEETLTECCKIFRWEVFAYAVMRNHFHLALATPQADLAEGMHWLQSTYATRFNRMRSERGHLFQGRYHALVVENAVALGRVVNYVHLNPVRAKIVSSEDAGHFRWGSLQKFVRGKRPAWLSTGDWLAAEGFDDTAEGWSGYCQKLAALAADPQEQKRQGFDEMCQGWAIGTSGWRKALAEEHAQLALSRSATAVELREMKEARWRGILETTLRQIGKTIEHVHADRKGAEWKIQIAQQLRGHGVPHRWIAEALNMGATSSLRVYLHQTRASILTA